ncbi:MAG: helix-turn-helix transcriptional regulator [Oscillospiraceae bacterium]|nr:helix-turn-helix transcriptional regulator [Oscillospiraceae bacterium]
MSSSAETIANNIKAARKAARLSQSELAARIGKSLRTVQGYENGETEPSITMIHEIAAALDVPSSSLLGYSRTGLQLNTVADVLLAIIELSEIQELNMEIEVKKPPHYEEWTCSLRFDGADASASENADICMFLEELRTKRSEYEGYWIDQAQYDRWVDHTLAYHAEFPVTKKVRPVLTAEEMRERKKAEVLREMEEIKRKREKAAGRNGDQNS